MSARLSQTFAEAFDTWWKREHGPGSGKEARLEEDDLPGTRTRIVAGLWMWCWQHEWRRPEHINLQEGTALLRAAERASQNTGRIGKQHLILTDCPAILGIVQGGRSSISRLNGLARKLGALPLAYRQGFSSLVCRQSSKISLNFCLAQEIPCGDAHAISATLS